MLESYGYTLAGVDIEVNEENNNVKVSLTFPENPSGSEDADK